MSAMIQNAHCAEHTDTVRQLTASINQLSQSLAAQEKRYSVMRWVYRWTGISLMLVSGILVYFTVALNQQVQAQGQALAQARADSQARVHTMIEMLIRDVEQDMAAGDAPVTDGVTADALVFEGSFDGAAPGGAVQSHHVGKLVAAFLGKISVALDAVPMMVDQMEAMNGNMSMMNGNMAMMSGNMAVIARDIDATMGRAGRAMYGMPFMPW